MECYYNKKLAERRYLKYGETRRTVRTLTYFSDSSNTNFSPFFVEKSTPYEGHQLANRLNPRVKKYKDNYNEKRRHVLDTSREQGCFLGEPINTSLSEKARNGAAFKKRNDFLNELAKMRHPLNQDQSSFVLETGGHAEDFTCNNFHEYLRTLIPHQGRAVKNVHIRVSHSTCTENDNNPSHGIGPEDRPGCLNKFLNLAQRYPELTFNITFDELFGFFQSKKNEPWYIYYQRKIEERRLTNIEFILREQTI